jgi:hypothetical protein
MREPVSSSIPRRTFLGFALVVLSGCGGPSPLRRADIRNVPPDGLPAEVQAPALRTGNWWEYIQRDQLTGLQSNQARITVTGTAGDGYPIREEWQQGGVVAASYDLDLNPTRTYNLSFHPAFPRFSFPLVIGKAWHGEVIEHEAPPKQFGTLLQQVSGSVGGWDRITVPAGTFRAMRIDLTVEWRGVNWAGWRGSSRETVWYVPEVRGIALSHREDFYAHVQIMNDNVLELRGFGEA